MRHLRILILLTVAMCCPMRAYGQTAPVSGVPRVAFINPGFGDSGFWKDVSDTMRAAAAQLGFEVIVFDSNRDWPLMAENTNRVFAMDPPPDYIIAVNEYQQGSRIVIEANARNIPVFMLLNDLTLAQKGRLARAGDDLSRWIATLTPDNDRAGYEIARSLVMAAQDAGPDLAGRKDLCLLTLAGDQLTPASIDRLAGLDRALREFPAMVEQRRLVVNWSYDEAYRRTRNWIEMGGCVDLVWAANDPIALGAIQALREAGRAPGEDVMIAGLNWSQEALDLVVLGEMTMTHGGHFMAGAWMMVLIHDYHHGLLTKGRDFSFPMLAIDRTNVAVFQDALGDRDWNVIDFGAFSRRAHPELPEYRFDLDTLLAAVTKRVE
ncbi:ABC transporter substrate-binding protein [Thalassospira sp.]|uniref:ABC transporter substrate-binding protein n=1 Tax=Thalassospira sp. TaxID=1912094 RepID=UPI002734232D|nr:ABC transporter substrate-binding protein [Thalassospira sp.]MDP2697465.1 ABC transporter substrate-binding protein [Thalassospira sp.]